MRVFGEYTQYYELLYSDKDYIGEAKFVKSLLDRYSSLSGSILELGCGAGKHAALLAEMGCVVHGIDFSPEMLELAEIRASELPIDVAKRLSWSEGDVRSYQTYKLFDAVISLFHVISYQPSNHDLQAAFETAEKHLKPGGVFLFDCWHGPTVLNDPPKIRIKKMENDKIHITRICEPEMLPNENGVIINYKIFIEDKFTGKISRIQESHHMRYLFTPEVQNLFETVGMRLVASGEWMTDKELSLDTFGVYYIGMKQV